MNNPQEAMRVTERLFEALSALKEQKQIRGIQTFTRLYGINRWNFITLRDNKETGWLKPEYLTYLVRDFNGINVKSRWGE